MGLGCFPQTNPLSLGMLGMHGTWYANRAVQECDLLIAVGARFDDRVTSDVGQFSPKSIKIHLDIDPACIDKNVPVDIAIVGHAKTLLQRLIGITDCPLPKRWLTTMNRWKIDHPLRYQKDDCILKPQGVIERLSAMTNGDSILVTDVGQHQMWVAQHYTFTKPRTLVTSGGLGTMGFGLPAAVGAAIGQPDATVICVCGDGGFRMTAFELSTAVRNRLPLKILIINNGGLGMVRQWQRLFYENRLAHSNLQDSNPDFVKLAESYGARAMRVHTPAEVDKALKFALEITAGPVVVEFVVAADENVYPMVFPGAGLQETNEFSTRNSVPKEQND